MNVEALDRWRRLPAGVCLERHNLEGHAKYLCYFLRHQTVWPRLVASAAESATHHLLAEQLRHEGPQANDVCHRAAIPAFGQHSNAHDAAHVTSRRMEGAVQLLRQVLKPVRKNGTLLGIRGP